MEKFKDYSTKEKVLTILLYVGSVILPVIILVLAMYFIPQKQGYEQMIDYQLVDDGIAISNVSKDEVLTKKVYIENKNDRIPYFVRFYIELDKDLLKDKKVDEVLTLTNSASKPFIYEDGYYYLQASKEDKQLLFDQITWLVDRTTVDKMKFNVKVETIEATNLAVTKYWLNTKALSKTNATKLGYIK